MVFNSQMDVVLEICFYDATVFLFVDNICRYLEPMSKSRLTRASIEYLYYNYMTSDYWKQVNGTNYDSVYGSISG